MRFGSLFSGIGGLDLGLERAGHECAWQVEIDEYASRVLAKHWPDVPRFGDVRECGAHNLEPVDLIAFGFPCQDLSWAGYGAGIDGERSGLWSEGYRIVCELRPTFVLVENVPALLKRGMDRVLSDLSSGGYDAEWSVVSACSVGATHMRRRLFIMAYTNGVDGRPRLRDSIARAFRPLQTVNGFEDSRAGWKVRLANPSELYGNADGLSSGLERNRSIGNAVVPAVAQWIGERLNEHARPLIKS